MAGTFLEYISFILDNDILQVETVLSQIHEIQQYLQRRYWNAESLVEFLSEFEELFIVENGRVAVFDPELESGRQKAVEYFEHMLSWYDEPPHYMNFRGHIGQADRDVINFINSFYPGEEFEYFLREYPDVFIVYEDTVLPAES